jgi:hypothetical protein
MPSQAIEAPSWFAPVQALTCAYGALLLLALYLRGHSPSDAKRERDQGLLFLACALGTWALAALVADPHEVDLWGECLSIVNSAFLLLAIRVMDHVPAGVQRLPMRSWASGVAAVCAATIVATLTLRDGPRPELLLSTATLVFLLIAFWRAFERRSFFALSLLSAVALLVELAAQWTSALRVSLPGFDSYVLVFGAKIMLVLTYLALAYTASDERDAVESPAAEPDAGGHASAPSDEPRADAAITLADARRATLSFELDADGHPCIALRCAGRAPQIVRPAPAPFLVLLDLAVARRLAPPDGGWRVPADVDRSSKAVQVAVSKVHTALGLGRSKGWFLVEARPGNKDERRLTLAREQIVVDPRLETIAELRPILQRLSAPGAPSVSPFSG